MNTTHSTLIIAISSCIAHAQCIHSAHDQIDPIIIDDSMSWTHFGGNSRHQSKGSSLHSIPSLDSPSWITSHDGSNSYIPVPQSGLVADSNRVYSIATNPDQPGSTFAIALDLLDGTISWAQPLAPRLLDSWSTPTINIEHGQIIIANGDSLTSLSIENGSLTWSTPIDGIVINASPVVTSDRGDRDRAFITNYSFGGGASAKLTCINIDPFHNTLNPYQPGEIVWQSPLNGDSSGNTPAYSDGTVYVATASSGSNPNGQIHAFSADSLTSQDPIWSFTNPQSAGFFGGVSIAKGHVFASSYSFFGLQLNSNTIKLNKQTGDLVWSIPTNRTDTTPVILDNGHIVISGGVATGSLDFLPFYGSLPSISLIEDHGSSATLSWDSAIDTLDDSNSNGIWDFGESFLSIGGWTHQPIAFSIENNPMLLVGTLPEIIPGVQIGHNTQFSLIDLSKSPIDSGFVIDQYIGLGSTPAIIGNTILSSGQSGIGAFKPLAPTPLKARSIIHQYINGSITIEQLKDALSR